MIEHGDLVLRQKRLHIRGGGGGCRCIIILALAKILVHEGFSKLPCIRPG